MKGGLTIVKARIIAQFSNVHFVQPRFELFPICFSQELGFAGRLSKGARCDISKVRQQCRNPIRNDLKISRSDRQPTGAKISGI